MFSSTPGMLIFLFPKDEDASYVSMRQNDQAVGTEFIKSSLNLRNKATEVSVQHGLKSQFRYAPLRLSFIW